MAESPNGRMAEWPNWAERAWGMAEWPNWAWGMGHGELGGRGWGMGHGERIENLKFKIDNS